MTVLEQLRKTIEDGHPGETEKLVREALKQHIPAGRIVEEAMTPAMRTVRTNRLLHVLCSTDGSGFLRIGSA